MVGLVDIGKLQREVTVRGVTWSVTGIKGRVIHMLLDQFPEVRKLLSGAGVPLKPEDLFRQAPEVVNIIIAHCSGDTSPKAIDAAAELTLGEQFDVIKVIWEITFPNGVESIVIALRAMGFDTGPIWAQAIASQEPLSSSSPADTPKT